MSAIRRVTAAFVVALLSIPFPASSPAQSVADLPLNEALKAMRAEASWDPLQSQCVLWRGHAPGDEAIVMRVGDPNALFGRSTRRSVKPPYWKGDALFFPSETVALASAWFDERDAIRASRFRIAAIIVDPGHGGRDGGAVGEHGSGSKKLRVLEKDIALAVAKDVHSRLVAAYPDKTILLTRSDDSYPTLEDRVEIANSMKLEKNEAIIYVSIHANASFNKSARGFEVWYLNPEYQRNVMDDKTKAGTDPAIASIINEMLAQEYLTESVMLAKAVLARLDEQIGASSPNRGTRAEEWFVVKNAKMPSILVEVGFVSNAEEAALLASPDYLKRVAAGIYTGVLDFVTHFEMQERH